MLIKLIKNDFIQTGRVFLWLLVAGLAGGGIGTLIAMQQNLGAGRIVIGFIWNFLLLLLAAVLQTVGVVIILVRTNRALFSEQGYLTFALPVSTFEMLLSKFITNVALLLLNIAEAAGLFYVVGKNLGRLVTNASESILEKVGLSSMKDEVSTMIEMPSFSEIARFFSFLLLVVLIFLVFAMMVCLFTLTISHVRPFQAKPGIFIPLFLVGTSVVSLWLVNFISGHAAINVPLHFGGMLAEGVEPFKLNLTIGLVPLGISVGLFFLTNWLLSRKISLK
ncbi:MAG: hypothetical protein LBB50_00520 [Oscillospiraceae bacterium]|jgi:hypothetical protein|nr:hypothetical protein [Oscillospiraceae bacterium]